MKEDNSICLLLPYFGRFPNYFDKWLLSAKKNDFIDFYIITDSENNHSDENIHYVNMPLGDIKKRVETCVGYKVCLESPYKLCDYKPTYGDVFSDITSKYDWWGYIDPDIVFGDMRLLFSYENLNSYDVIGGGGWCTLLRNSEILNHAYAKEISGIHAFVFREATQTNRNMTFDEWGFGLILDKIGIRKMDIYNCTVNICADITPFPYQKALSVRFLDAPIYGKYSGGVLVTYCYRNGSWNERKNAFIHLQKRYMNNYAGDDEEFLIVDNAFLPLSIEKNIRDKFENHPEPLDWTKSSVPKQSGLVKLAYGIDKVRSIGLKPIFLRILRHSKGLFRRDKNTQALFINKSNP